MNRFHSTLKIFAFVVFTISLSVLTQAQATRTWVSGVGDDVNPCSRTAPCKTFAGAISKTAVNGEINAIDPGGYGALTITKSITVDGKGTQASTLNAGTSGFIINYDAFAGTDTRRSVRIRNVSIQGANTGTNGVRIIGGATTTAGSKVLLDRITIDGNFGSSLSYGIVDTRSGGGQLTVLDSKISNNSWSGITIAPLTGSTRIDVVIDNVHVQSCGYGIAIGNGVRATVNRSVFSSNTNAGLFVEGPVGASELHVNNCITASNGTGVQQTAGGIIRIAHSDITFNATGISGTVLSYGNNRVAGNGGAGMLSPIGGVSNDFGQQ